MTRSDEAWQQYARKQQYNVKNWEMHSNANQRAPDNNAGIADFANSATNAATATATAFAFLFRSCQV